MRVIPRSRHDAAMSASFRSEGFPSATINRSQGTDQRQPLTPEDLLCRKPSLAMVGLSAMMTDERAPARRRTSRGFLNARVVHAVSFWIITGCILIAVVAAILAIWEFTKTDVLWRTVATCIVIGAGTLLFAWVNGIFGVDGD